jgi:hypothetical protein
MSYFAIMLFYDETRKVLMRHGFDRSVPGTFRLKGWFARNTFY